MSACRWARCAVCVAVLSALAGCVSPREHLYLLAEEVSSEGRAVPGRSIVLLAPVTVPPEVDRPQIVVTEAGYEVSINEQERWVRPLKDAVPRLLAEELSHASPYRFATDSAGASRSVKGRLAVEIYRFEVSRTRGATVAAHWHYHATAGDEDLYAESVGRAGINTGGYGGLVDALRNATTDLARRMAGELAAHE